ncbi:MAG: hypothetical protein VB876_05215 [Pirellulales bacterium]
MNFAKFGSDPHCATLSRLIESSDDCQIVYHADGVRNDLFDTTMDAVLVGFVEDETELRALIRHLAEFRKPIVLSHPANLSLLTHYEIEHTTENLRVPIVPVWPDCDQPAIDALISTADPTNQSDAEGIGTVEQARIARFSNQTDYESLLRQFACDMATIRPLVGDLSSVGGMSLNPTGKMGVPTNVQMTGPRGILVHWSVEPFQRDAGTTISINGTNGVAKLTIADGQHTLETRLTGTPARTESWDRTAIERSMLDGLRKKLTPAAATAATVSRPRWDDATRSLELAEALEKSLKKKRLVHLNYEGRGEANAFKGTMASLGCALLCGGMLLMIVTAVLSRVAEVQQWGGVSSALSVIPYLLLATLVIFLLVQLLRFVIPVKSGDG